MTPEQIVGQCRVTFAEILERDTGEVGLDDDFFQVLDGDSLGKLELVTAIEQGFGVRFSVPEALGLNTVSAMAQAVFSKLNGQVRDVP